MHVAWHFKTYSYCSIRVKRSKPVFNGTKINCTVLDQQLNRAANFDQKCEKAISKHGLLRRLKPLMTSKAANAVYTSAIIPALMYNCIVQLNLTQTHLKKLQSIEARASFLLKSKTYKKRRLLPLSIFCTYKKLAYKPTNKT